MIELEKQIINSIEALLLTTSIYSEGNEEINEIIKLIQKENG